MLVPELGLFLLNIPKCGSSTVKRCLEYRMLGAKIPNYKNQYIDHLSLSEMAHSAYSEGFNINTLRVVGLVRNPLERYLSALNFVFAQERQYTLDQCVNLSFLKTYRGETFYRYDILFRPMFDFLDTEVSYLDLYRFEDMASAVQSFGYFGPIPHIQKSTQRFSLSDIEMYIEPIKSFYKNDLVLYENTPTRSKEKSHVC